MGAATGCVSRDDFQAEYDAASCAWQAECNVSIDEDTCIEAATAAWTEPDDSCRYRSGKANTCINDMYEIGAVEASETRLLGAADFPDTSANRRLIDEVAQRNGWSPYRSLITYLAYHLQESDMVLI